MTWRPSKGVAQVRQHEIGGTLAALSLTKVHSLRHRLVRSRQYTHRVECSDFLDFEISKKGERVGPIIARLGDV